MPLAQTKQPEAAALPIGLFDSGVGGITVLSALRRRLPSEPMLYLGDTARLPYGTKGSDTVIRYALQATEKLVERDIKLLVVACNTATAAALPALKRAYGDLPVVGVVEPGARAACQASGKGRILVLATESTVRNQAYRKAIQALRPQARVTEIACSLFVPMAEEGWMSGPILEAVAERYLEPVLQEKPDERPDCIVLGCTHFPPLSGAIHKIIGEDVTLVDSAATTAQAVEEELRARGLLTATEEGKGEATVRFLTTDAPERFARVGGYFYGRAIPDDHLELVVL